MKITVDQEIRVCLFRNNCSRLNVFNVSLTYRRRSSFYLFYQFEICFRKFSLETNRVLAKLKPELEGGKKLSLKVNARM